MASTEQRPHVRVLQMLENAAPLDGPGKAIAKQVRSTIAPGALKDALSGTWLGHALHPPVSYTHLTLPTNREV